MLTNMTRLRLLFLASLTLCAWIPAGISASASAQPAGKAPSSIILVHGHRGSRATRPENTIPAFQFAIQHGADVLELDLSVTKDNVLVVSHSPYLTQAAQKPTQERVCKGPALPPMTPIHTLTLAQVMQYDCGATALAAFPRQVPVPGTHMATFDEVLGLLASNPKIQLNVETKISPKYPELSPSPAEFVRLILEAIHHHHADESRIILQSFDFRTLTEMHKQDPAIRLSALIAGPNGGLSGPISDPNELFVRAHQVTGAEIISPEYNLVTPERVAAAHRANVQVVPWTPDTPADWQKLADTHVDAIITDDPAALLDWLKAQHPPLH